MQERTRHHPFWLVEAAVATAAFAFLLAGDPRTVLQDSEMSEVARSVPNLEQALTLWSDVRSTTPACVTTAPHATRRMAASSQEAAAAASPAGLLRRLAQGPGPALCP